MAAFKYFFQYEQEWNITYGIFLCIAFFLCKVIVIQVGKVVPNLYEKVLPKIG